MKIFINDEELNFKIENEKTVFDIVSQIQQWVEKNNRFIKEFSFNNQIFYKNSEELKNIPIDNIDNINFKIITSEELAYEALLNTYEFFNELKNLRKLKIDNNLISLFKWSYNILSKAKVVLSLNFNEENNGTTINKELIKLDSFIKNFEKFLENNNNENEIKEYISKNVDIDIWILLLYNLINKIKETLDNNSVNLDKEQIEKKLYSHIMEIPEIIKKIEEITSDLHTGNDSVGMHKLQEISNLLAKIIEDLQLTDRALDFRFSEIEVSEGKTISDILISLTDIFKQIVDAFDNNDIVLLCDLLEYELIPNLELLSKIFNILIEKLKESYN